MNREMQIARAVAFQSDALRSEAERFGCLAAKAIGPDAGNRQIKGLESIANSTLKVSDVLDYLKRQTAKCQRDQSWRKDRLGANLLEFISGDLAKRCDLIAKSLEATPVERQRIHLLLVRAFVYQLAAHYAFAVSQEAAR